MKDKPIFEPEQNRKHQLLALILLLTGFLLITCWDDPFLPLKKKPFPPAMIPCLISGIISWIACLVVIRRQDRTTQRRYAALFVPLVILAFAPINTDLSASHFGILGLMFVSVIVLPPLILKDPHIITFKFFPDKIDKVDVLYTLISIPLAWGAFKLYFGVMSPEVPFNWPQPPNPEGRELFKLFCGINGVGIWDELFFINICFAILRSMFPMRIANPAQAVIYTTVLCDMAFTGWGPLFVGFLALTQGLMYERSRVLIWVLIVHLIVDYFLFQSIVTAYYPDLDVWWHP